MEGKQQFLHGTLEVSVFHATPYQPSFPFNCLHLKEKPAYVTIDINNTKVAKTSHEKGRVWNQTFQILCAHPRNSTITITVKTKCFILGKIDIPASQILQEASLINGSFPLLNENGKPTPELKLRLMVWFKPAKVELSWRNLINSGEFQGLKNATFPLRSNCSVALYKDAHCSSSFQPPFHQCGSPRKLWEDVYKAIDESEHLIYIAGWSFSPQMVLVQDQKTEIPHARGVKLGELLKRKAEEGVAVRILIWDDETSLPLIRNKGVMRTSDEDAFAYFKPTKVVCKLCPRLHHKFPTIFAHHQKTITVDTRSQNLLSNREITSFIGGLDLCNGRYDTEEHSLFHTLNTESHGNDFYQTSISKASLNNGGPRQPWHDTHACITGDAALDILSNFEQRWSKHCNPSLLVPINTLTHLFHQPPCPHVSSEKDWKIQVFRSIDHVSAANVSKKFTVEKSIHEAYVEAIRRAERFIYIENQYFIGGCHLWEKDRHSGCTNLIPIEIALKITSKIKAKERFAVYIIIPMWPEGVPESEPVQDILHWTRETMAMMYKLIGEAIEERGEPAHPRDYLNFYCLANREEKSAGEFVPPYLPHVSTQYWRAQNNRRFMIYVHSKLMIVDDLYLLIGSANINQRSMDGQRDTEIAIGCYQSKTGDKNTIREDIQRYRMSLWYEHTGQAEELFEDPESLQCVYKIRSVGNRMWKVYSEDELIDMKGVHLVTYPVSITKDGCVEDLASPAYNFPDTKAPVEGKRSKFLPSIFTT